MENLMFKIFVSLDLNTQIYTNSYIIIEHLILKISIMTIKFLKIQNFNVVLNGNLCENSIYKKILEEQFMFGNTIDNLYVSYISFFPINYMFFSYKLLLKKYCTND